MVNTLRHKPLKWRIRNTYVHSSLKFAGDQCPAACWPAGDSQVTASFLSNSSRQF